MTKQLFFAEYFNTTVDYMLGLTQDEHKTLTEIERYIELFIIYVYPFFSVEEWASKVKIDKMIPYKIKSAFAKNEAYAPRSDAVNKIAQYFNCSVEWLTNGRIQNAKSVSEHNEKIMQAKIDELIRQNKMLVETLEMITRGNN